MEKSDFLKSGVVFEQIVGDIFRANGFGVDDYRQRRSEMRNYRPDFFMEKGRTNYLVEVKYSRNMSSSNEWLCRVSEKLELYSTGYPDNYKKVIVLSSLVDGKLRSRFEKRGVYIVDVSNLLFMVSDDRGLYDRLVSCLDFSVQTVDPCPIAFLRQVKKDKFCPVPFEGEGVYERKIRELSSFNGSPTAYENICCDILKLLFNDYLKDCGTQYLSNDGLYRFDAVFKIKSNTTTDFFDTLKQFFNTQYVIFEFKNYREKISQREIYTTEKYLYTKALRSVAIIVSRHGADDNAVKAAKGALRESGKLIINLSDADLIEMLRRKANGNETTEYLSDILDSLLITLEK